MKVGFRIIIVCIFLLSVLIPFEKTAFASGDDSLEPNGSLMVPHGFSGSVDPEELRLASVPGEARRFAVGDDLWSTVDGLSGLGSNADVQAIYINGSDVYIGGTFLQAGNIPASNIAHWDGSTWHALGSGVDGTVYALTMDSSGNLYAGGDFTTAGGITAKYIAMWNGSAWQAMGDGFSNAVYALLYNGTSIYAGGAFWQTGSTDINCIARWDGNTWNGLVMEYGGSSYTGLNSDVRALAWDGTTLYAGGSFSDMGNSPGLNLQYVAGWNQTTSTWSALNGGVTTGTRVYSLLYTSALYVGGTFTQVGGSVSASNVARYDPSTTTWTALGTGTNGIVRSLVYDGATVVAGGGFNIPYSRVARWDGSAWSGYNTGLVDDVYALGYSGDVGLFAGGKIPNINGGTDPINNITWWDSGTGEWVSLTSGGISGVLQGIIYALAWDESGNLYVGGDFGDAGAAGTSSLVRYTAASKTWSTVGGAAEGTVRALLWDDTNDCLYVGGFFQNVNGGTQMVNHVAKYTPATDTWEALGYGLGNIVYALAIDSGGTLYAGGNFTTICGNQNCTSGNIGANRIAKFNGGSWSVLGGGLNSSVRALAVDGSDRLYVAGQFTRVDVGGLDIYVNGIARWSGAAWQDIGSLSGSNAWGNALARDGNTIYVGGLFGHANGVSGTNGIASFDTTTDTWSALGYGVDTGVYSLSIDLVHHRLYVGGMMSKLCQTDDCADYASAQRVGYYDSEGWHAMGSGVAGPMVWSLAYSANDALAAGGAFNHAGSVDSLYLALWGGKPVAGNDTYDVGTGVTLNIAANGVLWNDSDPKDLPLTATNWVAPAHASTFVGNADGSFSYRPVDGYLGSDAITYAADNGYFMDEAEVAIQVVLANWPTNLKPLNGSTLRAGVVKQKLSWKLPAGITKKNIRRYEVQVSTTPDFSTLFKTKNSTATSWMVTGLAPNQTYYWRVRAIIKGAPDTVGSWSSANQLNSFITGLTKPPTQRAPGNNAKQIKAAVKLTWKRPTGCPAGTLYTLQYSADPTFAAGVTEVSGLAATSYTITALPVSSPAGSTLYYWRVKAWAADGSRDYSGWQPSPRKFKR
jgi:hypothetical protein